MTAQTEEMIDLKGIAQMFRASIYTVRNRWVRSPGFPLPAIQPSLQKRMWRVSDVIAWATPKGK